jgi:hypothetical protein
MILFINLIKKYKNHYLFNYEDDSGKYSMIYSIIMPYKTPDDKYIVKIGYTTNLRERIKQLNNNYSINIGEDSFIILLMEVKNEKCEKKIHTILHNVYKYSNVFIANNNEYVRPGNICNELYIFDDILFRHLLKLISEINDNNDSIEMIKEKTK